MKLGARIHFSEPKKAALQARRKRIGLSMPSGMLLAASRPAWHRYEAAYFRYRQDPNFYYLSGLNSEDQGVCVLLGSPAEPKSILFVSPRDSASEIWNGPMLGLEGAATLGFDEVYPLDELSTKLPELMQSINYLYTDRQHHQGIDRILEDIVFKQKLIYDGVEVRDFWGFIGDFRLFKDPYEIELMQSANRISSAAHLHCMKAARAGMTELELQTILEAAMKTAETPVMAYQSIVASGSNSCCLHYNINSCRLAAGELVLIDAGAAFEGYAADITRTWPVDAKFSAEQKIIYEIVLATQKSIIASLQVGQRIPELQDAAKRMLTQNLIDAGILTITLEAALADDTYKSWYPHGVSHWLGLNVHDAGRYLVDGQRRPLEAGMVLTVEPGIYIQPGSTFTDKRWHGIGIRIEDDLLMTQDIPLNLTDCPKELAEIEALRH